VLWWGEEKEDRHGNVNLAGQDGEKTGIIHTKQKKKTPHLILKILYLKDKQLPSSLFEHATLLKQ